MTFKTVPVNVVGPSYESRSLPLSVQVTQNLYPEANPTGRTETALHSWPGAKLWFTGASDEPDRGMHVMNGSLFKVSGDRLYRYTSAAAETDLGEILGSDHVGMANDGVNLIITTGNEAYQYDGSTLTEITDTDFEPANTVAYLNNQMIFDGSGGRFQVADVGDPDSINALNFATAESAPDNTIAVFTFNERLYLFGEETIETWYNSGTGNPPFDRIQGGTMNVGLAAVHSVAATDQFVYFLGSDKSIHRVSAYQAQSVTPPAIAHALETASDVSDAIAYTLKLEGQSFYVLTLPTANKTFVYSEDLGAFFELSSGVDGDRHLANSYVFVYGKHLIADHNNGNIYEWDLDTFTDNSNPIIRRRVTAPINAQSLEEPGGRLMMSRFQLIMETGTGTATGQGVDPQVIFEASYDGGKSWTNEDWIKIGRTGEGMVKVEWYNMATFYDLIVRITLSDPVFLSIHSAAIDLKFAGH